MGDLDISLSAMVLTWMMNKASSKVLKLGNNCIGITCKSVIGFMCYYEGAQIDENEETSQQGIPGYSIGIIAFSLTLFTLYKRS